VPGYASTFLARNRLIAALASVVVVVQAPHQSGAMSTAKHAVKLGRPLLAVPYAPWEERGAGCLALLATGAQVCRSSADVLSHFGPSDHKPASRPRRADAYEGDLDEDERLALRALSSDVLTADDLCDRTTMSAARAQRAILMLLLSGLIQEVGAGRYARR
jgi:DNA processing protein